METLEITARTERTEEEWDAYADEQYALTAEGEDAELLLTDWQDAGRFGY